MSQIKKFYQNGWKKFAETNNEAKSIPTSFKDGSGDTLFVEDVLEQQQDDIDKIKRNIAWLALHGGGGSGSGTGSGTTKAKCTIAVEGKATGSTLNVTENEDLHVSFSKIQPLTSNPSWNIVITVGGDVVVTTTMNYTNAGNGITIPYNKFKDKIANNSAQALIVNATYTDDASGVYGQEQWQGTIRIAAVSLSLIDKNYSNGELIMDYNKYQSYRQYYNGTGPECEAPLLAFSTKTAIFGTYTFTITATNNNGVTAVLKDEEIVIENDSAKEIYVYLSYLFADKVHGGDTTKWSTPLQGLISKYFTGSGSDTYRITASISNNNQDLSKTIEFNFLLDDGEIHISTSGVSVDPLHPTQISKDSSVVYIPFVAYYTKGSTTMNYELRAYKSVGVDGSGNVTYEPNYVVAKSGTGKFKETMNPYAVFSGALADTSKIYKFEVYVTSSEGSTKSGSAFVYCRLVASSNTFIRLSDDAEKHLVTDFRADNFKGANDFSNNNFQNLVLKSDTYLYGDNVRTICTDMEFFRPNNLSGMKVTQNTAQQPYLRLTNGTYVQLKNTRVCTTEDQEVYGYNVSGDSNCYSKNLLPSDSGSTGWTISLCYKPDYHADDKRTIFVYGNFQLSDANGGTLNNGLSIDCHGIYVNGDQKIAVLTDNTINVVQLVYQKTTKTYIDQTSHKEETRTVWYLKVYVDGVLTAVIEDQKFDFSGASCYLAGRYYVDGHNQEHMTYLCDTNIYSLQIFDAPLDDKDILGCYINCKMVSNYKNSIPDYGFKIKELPACFCEQIEDEGVDKNRINSFIYTSSGYSISKLVNVEGIIENDNDSTTSMGKLYWANKLGIPIIQLDLSGNGGWTFANFTQQLSASDKSSLKDVESATMHYWDPSGTTKDILHIDGVTVGIQGTSTKADTVKNLNVTLPKALYNDPHIRPLFVPKATWLPEDTYTLKADIVDSSHSNNAAIGKCINDVFGYDIVNRQNNTYFPFDEHAIKNVYGDSDSSQCYRNMTQPTATLKHTVEGFPVFLIIKFRVDSTVSGTGSTTASFETYPVGIYSFNLGRDAFHNLGMQKITRARKRNDDGTYTELTGNDAIKSFPAYIPACKYEEPTVSDTYWIEESDTRSCEGMKYLTSSTTMFPKDSINTYEGDFWQYDPSILNQIYEVRFPDGIAVSDVRNFATVTGEAHSGLVEKICNLPIETPYLTNSASEILDYDCSGPYYKGKYEKGRNFYDDVTVTKKDGVDVQTRNTIQMINDTNGYSQIQLNERLNVSNAQKYFCIAMLFGLVDNFSKNVSYRCWNNGPYYPEFYDLDTAFGCSNQGILNIAPALWFKFLNNVKNGTNAGNIYETYDETDNYGYVTPTAGSTDDSSIEAVVSNVSGFHNKLWLSLDTKFMRTLVGRTYSIYSEQWFALRKYLDNYAKNYSTPYSNFLDFFMEEYYKTQTGSCGSLLFNYDYRLKYLHIFKSIIKHADGSTNETIEDSSALSKLHGRKIDYTRNWLKEHICFLDSAFKWRAKRQDVNNAQQSFQNEINSLALITTTNTPNSFPIKTNKTVVMYNDAQGVSGFVLAPKNKEVTIHSGDHRTNSEYNLQFDNVPSVIELGNDTYKLKDLNVTKFTHTASPLGPIDSADGFSSLTVLNFAQNIKFTSGFNINSCCVGNMSELREINFSETTGNNTTYQLNLVTGDDGKSTKYTKLTSIDIHNSMFISELDIPEIPLIYLNVTNSLITRFKLSNQFYLNDVSLAGCDRLQTIEINNCNCFRNDINISSRSNLTTLKITQCDNITSITISDCPSLTAIAIEKCAGLKKITITGCKQLVGTSISNYVKILQCNSLQQLLVTECTALQQIEFNHESVEKMTTVSFYNTKIRYIKGYNKKSTETTSTALDTYCYDTDSEELIAVDVDNECNVINLKKMTGLTSLNLGKDDQIVCVLLNNDQNKPVNLSNRFINCSSLHRIFGNWRIDCSDCFSGCGNFSIFGTEPEKWNGCYVCDSTGRIRTVWEILAIKNSSSINDLDAHNYESLISGSTWNVDTNIQLFNHSKSFVEDTNAYDLAVNMSFSTHESILASTFDNTYISQFDVYYALYRLAMCVTSTGLAANYTFEGTRALFSWANKCEPSRYTFYKIGNKIKSFGWTFNSAPTKLYSPEYKKNSSGKLLKSNGNVCGAGEQAQLIDNGLFSPLTNLTSIDRVFSGSFVHDNNLFKRSDGQKYPITDLYRWNCGIIHDGETGIANSSGEDQNKSSYDYFNEYRETYFDDKSKKSLNVSSTHYSKMGNINTFFDNFQTTTNIFLYYAFGDMWAINFATARLPKNISKIEGVFKAKYSTGEIVLNNIFKENCPCTVIADCFYSEGGLSGYTASPTVLKIVPGMFDHVLGLQYLGGVNENSLDNSQSFYGAGITKYLVPDYYLSTSVGGDVNIAFKYHWDDLCVGYDDPISGAHTNGLFERLTNLKYVNYFLANTRLKTGIHVEHGNVVDGVTYMGATPLDTNYESDVVFPGKLFKTNVNLQKLYRTMYNVYYTYELSSEGFASCTQLANVTEMCRTDLTDGNDDTHTYGVSSNSYIPYKFFYHGAQVHNEEYIGVNKTVDPQTRPQTRKEYQTKLSVLSTKCLNYGKKVEVDRICQNPENKIGTPSAKWMCGTEVLVKDNTTVSGWSIFKTIDGVNIGSIETTSVNETASCTLTLTKDVDTTTVLTTPKTITFNPTPEGSWKFNGNGLTKTTSGEWDVFKKSDGTVIGCIKTTDYSASDTQITLTHDSVGGNPFKKTVSYSQVGDKWKWTWNSVELVKSEEDGWTFFNTINGVKVGSTHNTYTEGSSVITVVLDYDCDMCTPLANTIYWDPDFNKYITIQLANGYSVTPSTGWLLDLGSTAIELNAVPDSSLQWTIFTKKSDGTAVGAIKQQFDTTSSYNVQLTHKTDMTTAIPDADKPTVKYTAEIRTPVSKSATFTIAELQRYVSDIFGVNVSAANSKQRLVVELAFRKFYGIDCSTTTNATYNTMYDFVTGSSGGYSSACMQTNRISRTLMRNSLAECNITKDIFDAMQNLKILKNDTAPDVYSYSDIVKESYATQSDLNLVSKRIMQMYSVGLSDWMSTVMNITKTKWDYLIYTTSSLKYMSRCFHGNRFMGAYQGETQKSEKNSTYCPYNWLYNSGNDTWTETVLDTKQYDDSWSFNGQRLYVDNEDPTLGYSNYDSTHKYAEDVENVLVDETDIFYGSAKSDMCHYYMCPPDMFRYTVNNADTDIGYFFANCGPTWKSGAGVKCLKGRVPPNLLRPLSTISSINGLFYNCKGIRGYKKKIMVNDVLTDQRYFMPEDFFSYAPDIYYLKQTFHGCCINHRADMSFLRYLNGRSALYINGIFAGVKWNVINTLNTSDQKTWTLTGIFTAFRIAGIGCAFSNHTYNLEDSVYGAKMTSDEHSDTYYTEIDKNILVENNFTATNVHNQIAASNVYGIYGNWPQDAGRVKETVCRGIKDPWYGDNAK